MKNKILIFILLGFQILAQDKKHPGQEGFVSPQNIEEIIYEEVDSMNGTLHRSTNGYFLNYSGKTYKPAAFIDYKAFAYKIDTNHIIAHFIKGQEIPPGYNIYKDKEDLINAWNEQHPNQQFKGRTTNYDFKIKAQDSTSVTKFTLLEDRSEEEIDMIVNTLQDEKKEFEECKRKLPKLFNDFSNIFNNFQYTCTMLLTTAKTEFYFPPDESDNKEKATYEAKLKELSKKRAVLLADFLKQYQECAEQEKQLGIFTGKNGIEVKKPKLIDDGMGGLRQEESDEESETYIDPLLSLEKMMSDSIEEASKPNTDSSERSHPGFLISIDVLAEIEEKLFNSQLANGYFKSIEVNLSDLCNEGIDVILWKILEKETTVADYQTTPSTAPHSPVLQQGQLNKANSFPQPAANANLNRGQKL